ncbi:Exonuclease DPD1 [Spatholobus suberectus]|nr:Exonuclease DPD1 [Spatholobus suberectus]
MAVGTECRTTSARIRMPIIGRDGFMYSTSYLSIAKRNTRLIHFNSIEYSNAEDGISLNQNSKHVVRVFVIDVETTGLSRERDRIIEIAIPDLRGSKNSCFTTLVNPEQIVPNSKIHNITTEMVKQQGVPRMKELIPILLEYIKSCLLVGEQPLFVAHNARRFDAQFLIKEFVRNSYNVPWDCLFVDSLLLAREAMKLKGSHHRATSDVNLLSAIFRRLIEELNLSASDLLERSFMLADIIK